MSHRGFTLIEFVVIVICIGVLSGLLLQRVMPLIGLAEKTAFEQVRGQLASALLLEAAERVARGESASLIGLEGANPMTLLLNQPTNYIGSFDRSRHARIPPRAWYFDESEHLLFYRPGEGTRVENEVDGPIALRVRFQFRDRDGDGSFNPSTDRFDGLRLEPVHAYSWTLD